MRREVQAIVFVVLGAVLLKLVISGEYLNYVQSLLQIPLIVTGVVLMAFGVLGLVRDWRGRAAAERSRRRLAPTSRKFIESTEPRSISARRSSGSRATGGSSASCSPTAVRSMPISP